MVDKISDGQGHGNADYQWGRFDSEAYFQHTTASRIPTTTASSTSPWRR